MAYPTEINALPANPETFDPNSLRTMYTALRDALQTIPTEMGSDPSGTSTVQARLTALESLTHTTKTSSYTLALADANAVVEMNSASATVVTVPENVTEAFPIGTVIEIFRLGAGTVTVSPAGGVTIRSAGSLNQLRVQYSSASLRKRATDEWVLSGDLA